MEWHVILDGNPDDLARISGLTVGLPTRVELSGGDYLLQAPEMTDLPHAADVHMKAAEIVSLINSAAALDDHVIEPLKVRDVYWVGDDGHRVHTLVLEGSIAPRGHVTLTPGAPGESAATVALRHLDNPNLRDAMVHFAENSWYGIYKALESIENELGGESQLLDKQWIPRSEIKLLKRTANAAAGEQTRHASGRFVAPEHPMAYGVARENVRILIQELARYIAALA